MQEAYEILVQAYANSGYLGAAAAGLTLALRFYRLPALQEKLPEKVKWDNLPPAAKTLLPFGVAAGASALAALASGVAWPVALTGAVVAGLGSIGLHHGTKLIGAAEAAVTPVKYQQSALRKAAEVIVPLPVGLYKSLTPSKLELLK